MLAEKTRTIQASKILCQSDLSAGLTLRITQLNGYTHEAGRFEWARKRTSDILGSNPCTGSTQAKQTCFDIRKIDFTPISLLSVI
jgi:hypothetical protein